MVWISDRAKEGKNEVEYTSSLLYLLIIRKEAAEYSKLRFIVVYKILYITTALYSFTLVCFPQNCDNYFIFMHLIDILWFSQLISSVEPSCLRLTQLDDKIYHRFREDFPDLNVAKLTEDDLKTPEQKQACHFFFSHEDCFFC